MKILYKLSSLIIAILIIFSCFLTNSLSAKAIKNFTVIPTNQKIGANSDYKFHFTIEKTVDIHNYIKMILPAGTKFEKIPTDPPDSKDPCAFTLKSIIEYQEDESVLFQFKSRIVLDPSREGYRDIALTIPMSGKIQDEDGNWFTIKFYNPTIPGKYLFKVATESEPELIESKPVEFLENVEEKPELPDVLNCNLWFSNLTNNEITAMLIHIPLKVFDLRSIKFSMLFPNDMIDMTSHFGWDKLHYLDNLKFIKEHVYINNIPLKESTIKVNFIGLTEKGNQLIIEIITKLDKFEGINILFDKELKIKFTKDGVLRIVDSTVTVENIVAGDYNRKDIKLIFQDNYIFPEE